MSLPGRIIVTNRESALGGQFRRKGMARARRMLAATVAVAVAVGLGVVGTPTLAAAAPVGQGFTVNTADLAFILKQIKIAEAHVANTTSATGPCGALLGSGANQVPDAQTSYGLRTVDGSCNNLVAGRQYFGAADQIFPRLTTGVFSSAEGSPAGFPPAASTSYAQKSGVVYDTQPRVISNLIVDQTSTNPAAVAAAGFPIRTQNAPGSFPCSIDPDPLADPPVAGFPSQCVPTGQTLFIPNVTTDVGLSPPYNSLFTLFGQFFDHGVDQTVKGGGTVFVPLNADDPLRTVGPDGRAGTGDEVSASQAFMVLTRAKNQPGADGALGTADDIRDTLNTDSPFIDQSQTYASHASHQVFLREYVNNTDGRPVATGKLLGGPAGPTEAGMADWGQLKLQARTVLGLDLQDADVTSVPMLAVDPYGKFIPGPDRGLPQYATSTGALVEGDTAAPVPVPADVLYFETPFLTDIANNADPSPADLDHNPATPKVAPVPDGDTTASADFAAQQPGTYDDEMLNAHFMAGDGRVNENIGLTAIHQVFHSEHDRLVDDIKTILTNDTTTKGIGALAEWKLALGSAGWNGERLFQAARFINEMEYQHLVFEDFGRKVQPGIDVFTTYHLDLDPAVKAEFAHAVYRFGHSMLTETISRTNANGSDNSISLLAGFLNPPSYTDGGVAGPLTSKEAAGSIVVGMSEQVGNELDEFVTGTLRNNLLGLPLDLATLNLTRARETGIPPLNEVRRQIQDATGDAALTPYASWADFGQNLKHPESLINFVAAYGTFPTITAATSLVDKRAAAKAIVDPGSGISPSPEALDFIYSAGAYASVETGVNKVDLWIGGLAEKTNVFGGLLGSTFNYVFESQMTDLQNGDRFYYLKRTPGMNLRAQLEGNSFAELIMRNTTAGSLKADAFATSDCKFDLANLAGTPAGFTASGPIVADDPLSECDESGVLIRMANGTIQYREINTIDPVGINGQSVYSGTATTDRVIGGNDNDTFLGNDGNDVIEGQGGDDIALGGAGNDRITDLAGNDIPKGGPGNDYLNSGPGLDILMGGDGADFTNGGANDNETFGGEGGDFIQSGDGSDATFGDGGDDWIQGGSGQDLLIGDHGAPFFDDPAQTRPGNEVMIGQVGENDYDAEGGDDIMSANAAVDRYAGSAGFDWANHQYDTVAANDDMAINGIVGNGLPIIVNRDRWQEVEGIAGSAFDDVIRGDSVVPSATGGLGFSGCDALDQTGIDRIAGLSDILPAPTTPLAGVEALSPMGTCPLEGPVWGEGNVLIGGLGSDTIEGRGGNDVIDGDRHLVTRISVRDDAGVEIGSATLMERTYQAGNTKTLAADVAAGIIDPGNLVIVRELITPTTLGASNRDSAVFSDITANYTVTTVGGNGTLGSPGSVTTVAHDNAGADGTDTLRNVERLVFSDTAIPAAPVIGTAVAGNGQATVNFTAAPGIVTSFSVVAFDTAGVQVGAARTVAAPATSLVFTGLTNGVTYQFQVSATNIEGTGPLSALSNAVTPAVPIVLPGPPVIGTPVAGDTLVTVNWTAPAPIANASAITGYSIRTFVGAGVTPLSTTVVGDVTSSVISLLTNGTGYTFDVTALSAAGPGAASARSVSVTPATVPGAPTVGVATAGSGSAIVRWTAPASNGGSAITGYTVRAFSGTTLATTQTFAAAAVSGVVTGLTDGISYAFDVSAVNGAGTGAPSALSVAVTPFTDTVAPTVIARVPSAGSTGASRTADLTVTFSEPVTGVSATTLTLRTGVVLVAATVTYDAATRVATINPNGSLTGDRTYTVGLTTAIRDASNNALAAQTYTFITGPTPTFTSRTPNALARSVSQTGNVTVTFGEQVLGVDDTSFSLRLGATTVPSAVTYNALTRVATLNPNASLAADSTYTVTLTSGIRDLAGNLFAPVTYTFTTGPAPTITAISPAVGALGVGRNSNSTALFSEQITGFTTATARITVAATGVAVPAGVGYTTATRVLTVDPTATLAANTQYRVTITGGTAAIRDLVGNPLATRTWVFTTGTGL